jgi:hypothetical protein
VPAPAARIGEPTPVVDFLDLIVPLLLIHLPPQGSRPLVRGKETKSRNPARPGAGGALLTDYSRDSAKAGPFREGASGAAARPMARTEV